MSQNESHTPNEPRLNMTPSTHQRNVRISPLQNEPLYNAGSPQRSPVVNRSPRRRLEF